MTLKCFAVSRYSDKGWEYYSWRQHYWHQHFSFSNLMFDKGAAVEIARSLNGEVREFKLEEVK